MSEPMAKLDLKKHLKHLYAPSAKAVSVVDVPAMNFLAIDGRGDPNSAPAYAAAVEALFSLSYALKFVVKKGPQQVDYGVMPLEGLWWADDMEAFSAGDRSQWQWTLLIMQPDVVTADLVGDVMGVVAEKKPLPALRDLRFKAFAEGRSAQLLHVGPFSTEGPTIERIHQHIVGMGHDLAGKHHEIYLSDIRKGDPARWKTVIRQPFT
ncbi:MAG TPA: GyrI-like domain-containing protein [Trueperaceae bacterium]|nr:GyrI-like domain-containing protein [Trueperaceae bacterium]